MSLWISPSFADGNEDKLEELEKCTPKEIKSVSGRGERTREWMWSEKYEPQKKEDLAVNPKKVLEVQSWLRSALNEELGMAPIAIFSGPSGSGKTTTLKVLSKSMGFSIKEWVTPSTIKPTSFKEDYKGTEKYCFEQTGQVKQFEDFLFRASRYSSVLAAPSSTRCVLLVEDIPNAYIHDSSLFEKTIRKFSEAGCSPIVFICSIGSTDLNLERLFYKVRLQDDLNIQNISFNPVSRKFIIGALKRLVLLGKKNNPDVFINVSEGSIERIADMSNSDVRFAINQLQFQICSRKGSLKDFPIKSANITKRKGKGKKKFESCEDFLEGKDQFIDVFRCLGRVLYCKKQTMVDEKTKVVKENLFYDPYKIVNTMSSIPNLFIGLLNENYACIFTDIKKISEAGGYLSHADIVMSNWRERDTEINFGLTISVLGLMNASTDSIEKKWNPFRRSKSKKCVTSYDEKLKMCKYLFPERIHETRILLTEIFPYYVKMDTSKLQEDQKKFVMSVTKLPSRVNFDEEDTDKCTIKSRKALASKLKISNEEQPAIVEEVAIEEYDSDRVDHS